MGRGGGGEKYHKGFEERVRQTWQGEREFPEHLHCLTRQRSCKYDGSTRTLHFWLVSL